MSATWDLTSPAFTRAALPCSERGIYKRTEPGRRTRLADIDIVEGPDLSRDRAGDVSGVERNATVRRTELSSADTATVFVLGGWGTGVAYDWH